MDLIIYGLRKQFGTIDENNEKSGFLSVNLPKKSDFARYNRETTFFFCQIFGIEMI